ncbi:hypothetical protein [Streptosporangium roseum]|uniref:Uncharacterized protein n=1 Tax=Streptosporangium roseum (strain ATCC 12428 / DSM 43021 / JCM 3005 / KCTC 9067 / NCIMB 10171 / NRRL 2505 / NI 9100) TaxID=479432 RepID=D2AQG1_STRRD|nr:hypothetical protein [Streptosporangium roseum]ACZ84505.1 hypothetical protein Sros_1512 [Streptosporangium roseum DSM 43021]
MSRFLDELRDPWGLLLGATAGGAAWAVSVHPAAAGAVGVAVWLAKTAIATVQGRDGGGRTAPDVTAGSREAHWLERAGSAARGFGELSASMGAGPLAERIALMRSQVDDSTATLERLAEQASLTGTALARFDLERLRNERTRLTRTRKNAREELVHDLDRALASLASQQAVVERLSQTYSQVLARMESSTISIEGLLARLVELSAMAAPGALEPTRVLDELADNLEGVRQGLHETEQITRDALDR